jgi:hypothetical protein
MENESTDPSTQVLVWDHGDNKRLKMPLGELYDKVGKTIRSRSTSEALMEDFRNRECQKGATAKDRKL